MKFRAGDAGKIKAILFWRNCCTFLMFIGLSPQGSAGQTLTLVAGGDVVWPYRLDIPQFERSIKFHDSIWDAGIPLSAQPFQSLGTTLTDADLAFVNLENPIASQAQLQPLPWAPTFSAHPQLASQLRDAGVDLVSTANNHVLDAGIEGVSETLSHLDNAQIQAAGTGSTIAQAKKPAIVRKNGVRVALLAYTQPDNSLVGYATATQPGSASINLRHIITDIKAVSADIILVSLHWGQTGQRQPTAAMRSLAHQIIDAGGDVILGHHPHVPQGIEIYCGKPIVYSLGNLVFPYTRPSWGDNMLVQLTLSRKRVENLQVLPIDGRNPARPSLLSGKRATTFLQTVQKQSAALDTHLKIQGDRGTIQLNSTLEAETAPLPPAATEKIDKSLDAAAFD